MGTTIAVTSFALSPPARILSKHNKGVLVLTWGRWEGSGVNDLVCDDLPAAVKVLDGVELSELIRPVSEVMVRTREGFNWNLHAF